MTAGLDIPAHTTRWNSWAVAALMLLAAGGFATGFAREAGSGGPAPFPPAQFHAPSDPPPAPDQQLAANPVATSERAAPSETPPNTSATLQADVAPSDGAPSADAAPAVDASATAADAPPPAPSTDPAPPDTAPPT